MSIQIYSAQQYCKFDSTKPIQIMDGKRMTSYQPGSDVVDAILVKSLKAKQPYYLAICTKHAILLFNGETVIKQIKENVTKLTTFENTIVGISSQKCVHWNYDLDTTNTYEVDIEGEINSISLANDRLIIGTSRLSIFSLNSLQLLASTSKSDHSIDFISNMGDYVFAASSSSNAINVYKLKKDKRKNKKLMLLDTVFVDQNIQNMSIFNGWMTLTHDSSFSLIELGEELIKKGTTILNQKVDVALCDLDKNGNLTAHLFIKPFSSYFCYDMKDFPREIELSNDEMQQELAVPKIAIMDQLEPTLGDLIPDIEPQNETEILLESTQTELTPLLLQAIKGHDQALLETCLQSGRKTAKKALKSLSPPAVTELIHLLNERMQKQMTETVMEWIEDLLVFHGSLIRSGPAMKDIYALEALISEKSQNYQQLMDVCSQLELALALNDNITASDDEMEM
eukprot:NODE_52_length_30984_cov_1.383358.p6 type:complete len:454 gc:universal NODE_52_length_30984_cov_1.383358:18486-19847(+)